MPTNKHFIRLVEALFAEGNISGNSYFALKYTYYSMNRTLQPVL